MKRIVSLVLALSMVLSMFATAFAGSTLTDVEGTEYEAAVSALVELGLVKGRGNNKYEPEAVVTRAEMAKLLVIASGLEDAAELNVGATKFSDVAANHWATGFINVASEYGFINGYPEGTFAPDAEVKYSEAVTMAIRALGYASVVESKGTWPTNYIQQARELKVLDKVKYASYSNGATRGNVALLVWNMLRTEMWDIGAENETNGLTYGKNGTTMIDKYFEDYTYAKVLFDNVSITDKCEVMVKLEDDSALLDVRNTLEKNDETYKYFGNDFYTFVPGTEVEVLVNEEEETLLTIVPTSVNELFEGTKVAIDDKYETISGDVYSYAYLLVDGKEVEASTQLAVESNYIYDINTTSKKSVKFNEKSNLVIKYEDAEETLFIIDGERVAIKTKEDVAKNIEVGSVLSKVSVIGTDVEFYMVTTPAEVEGELTKIVLKDFEDSAVAGSYFVATVGGKEVSMADNAVYFEDPEDFEATDIEAIKNNFNNDMKDEEVVAKLDFLNRIVAFEFDGYIGDEEDEYEVGFYAIESNVGYNSVTRKYDIKLENENGSDTYAFAKSYTFGKDLFLNSNADYIGTFCAVTFNDDGEIKDIKLLGNASGENDDLATEVEYESGDFFSITRVTNAEFDDEKMKVSGDQLKVSVDEDLVVFTLLVDDEDENEIVYSYEITKGTDAIAKLDGENIIVVKDEAKRFAAAKYIVLYDEISNKEDNLFAVIDEVETSEIDDKGLEVKTADGEVLRGVFMLNGSEVTEEQMNLIAAMLYSVEVDEDEVTYTIEGYIANYNLTLDNTNHAYIAKDSKNPHVSATGRVADITIGGTTLENVDLNDWAEDYEDTLVYILEVNVDEDDETENQYVAVGYAESDIESIKLKELDRISFMPYDTDYTTEVPDAIVIIRGFADVPSAE